MHDQPVQSPGSDTTAAQTDLCNISNWYFAEALNPLHNSSSGQLIRIHHLILAILLLSVLFVFFFRFNNEHVSRRETERIMSEDLNLFSLAPP